MRWWLHSSPFVAFAWVWVFYGIDKLPEGKKWMEQGSGSDFSWSVVFLTKHQIKLKMANNRSGHRTCRILKPKIAATKVWFHFRMQVRWAYILINFNIWMWAEALFSRTKKERGSIVLNFFYSHFILPFPAWHNVKISQIINNIHLICILFWKRFIANNKIPICSKALKTQKIFLWANSIYLSAPSEAKSNNFLLQLKNLDRKPRPREHRVMEIILIGWFDNRQSIKKRVW